MFFFDKIGRRTHPPLYASTVAAGFPSPADDYMEGALDLNEFLIAHPAATFMVRVEGASMTGAGILSNKDPIIDKQYRRLTVSKLIDFWTKNEKVVHKDKTGALVKRGAMFRGDSEIDQVCVASLATTCWRRV